MQSFFEVSLYVETMRSPFRLVKSKQKSSQTILHDSALPALKVVVTKNKRQNIQSVTRPELVKLFRETTLRGSASLLGLEPYITVHAVNEHEWTEGKPNNSELNGEHKKRLQNQNVARHE